MTRTVTDAALILQVMAGHDPEDATSLNVPVPDYLAALAETKDAKALRGLRVGLPEEYWGQGLSPEVEEACRKAVDIAQELGAEIVSVSLPHTKYAVAAYYILGMAEAGSNLARFDGVRYGRRGSRNEDLDALYTSSRSEGFGEEVVRRILLGTYVLSAGYYDAYYKKAAQVRRLIHQDFQDAFSRCDVLCGPVCPSTAFAVGEKVDDPLQMYLMDIFTCSLNLSGLPGLSLPVGLGRDTGLPVGLQILGGHLEETRILRTAAALEAHLPALPVPTAVS
jgi:aspartyl-tRNA(Asn)/glutamyl-tRNA(Gln) amidotransferase subunit A